MPQVLWENCEPMALRLVARPAHDPIQPVMWLRPGILCCVRVRSYRRPGNLSHRRAHRQRTGARSHRL